MILATSLIFYGKGLKLMEKFARLLWRLIFRQFEPKRVEKVEGEQKLLSPQHEVFSDLSASTSQKGK